MLRELPTQCQGNLAYSSLTANEDNVFIEASTLHVQRTHTTATCYCHRTSHFAKCHCKACDCECLCRAKKNQVFIFLFFSFIPFCLLFSIILKIFIGCAMALQQHFILRCTTYYKCLTFDRQNTIS